MCGLGTFAVQVAKENGCDGTDGSMSRGLVMKAIVWTAYGPPDVLRLREVATPTPKVDEVRIRICATANLDEALTFDCAPRLSR